MSVELTERDKTSLAILSSAEEVLRAADHLVNEYTRKDQGFGTGVGMKSAEDLLIRRVETWRTACGTGR